MWLARDEGDGAISRYLIGSKDPFAIRKGQKFFFLITLKHAVILVFREVYNSYSPLQT